MLRVFIQEQISGGHTSWFYAASAFEAARWFRQSGPVQCMPMRKNFVVLQLLPDGQSRVLSKVVNDTYIDVQAPIEYVGTEAGLHETEHMVGFE